MKLRVVLLLASLSLMAREAPAFDVDWSGQFWVENQFVHNYQLGSGNGMFIDSSRDGKGGYYIPGGGSYNAHWQSLFLRLKPKLIVNDNIAIKSEWWVGDPIYGAMGNAAPYTIDQRQFYSNQSRGSFISAQRFWGEFLSDLGTIQVGRQPLHWGLGIVWNSGDKEFSRYMSTGDAIRVVSKFGNFTVAPAVVKYTVGNSYAGSRQYTLSMPSQTLSVSQSDLGGSVTDYSLQFLYGNRDEEFDTGVNFIKRIGGAGQDPMSGYLGVGAVSDTGQPVAGMNYNTWDLFFKKKLGKFTLMSEIPVVSGTLAGVSYKTYALALDLNWAISDSWETGLLAGSAPGQQGSVTNSPDRVKVFYFHPNYKPALIMFNYNLAAFAGPNTLNNSSVPQSGLESPYDNPIVNAKYLSWSGAFKTEKWKFHTTWTYAKANEAAGTVGNFYNVWDRKYYANASGKEQSKSMGWEMDYGTEFKWDEVFKCGLDFGWFFPGEWYSFSNTANDNSRSSILGVVAKASVNF